MKQIRNTRELRKTVSQGQHEFKLTLQGGLCSSKFISLMPDGRFAVTNYIDDTDQKLTGRQLYSESNIGRAMRCGAFVVSEWEPAKRLQNYQS